MSLINDMLKNLERRRAHSDEGDQSATPPVFKDLVLPSEASKWPEWRRMKTVLFFMMIIVFGIGGLWILSLLFSSRGPLVSEGETGLTGLVKQATSSASMKIVPAQEPSKEVSKEHKTQTTVVVSETPHEVALLKSLVVNQQADQTLLQFTLSRAVHYQIEHTAAYDSVKLILSQTKLETAVPDLSGSLVIKNIDFKKQHKNLIVSIQVVPGTSVHGLGLGDEGEQAKLTLVLLPLVSQTHEEGTSAIEKTELPLTTQQRAELYYNQALVAIGRDDMKNAIIALKKSLQHQPENINACKTLATLFLQQKQYPLAESVLQNGLKHHADSIDLIQLYAQVLISKNQPQKALTILQRLSPEITDHAEYYALMATLQQRIGHAEIAAQLYSQLLRLDSSNGSWWMGLAIAFESLEKSNAAANAYQKAAHTGDLSPSVQAFVETKITQLGG